MSSKDVVFDIGMRVETDKGCGSVAFHGATAFSDGIWVGIILDHPNGKNNGTVQGKAYFNCDENFGIFVRAHQVICEGQAAKSRLSMAIRTSSANRKDPFKGQKTASIESGLKSISPSICTDEKLRPAKKPPSSIEDIDKNGAKLESGPDAKSAKFENKTDAEAIRLRIRKLEELTSPTGRLVPEEMSQGAKLEYLRAEHRDLSEKLDTLRVKRREDKNKLIEYERCRIQLQQLVEYKSQMSEIHADTLRQLQQAKKETKEAIEALEQYQDEMSGFSEQLEMTTVEKEMAEEKVDLLQQEFDALKEYNEQLETDLEIVKAEMDMPENSGGNEGNVIQMKQIQQQNERLKEALVKMRDLNGQISLDSQQMTKENKELRVKMEEIVKNNDKMQQNYSIANQQMNDLQEQVDAALGAEQMVEKLASDNLILEEKVRESEEALEDLETIRQMDEEMWENQKEVEKELRLEQEKSTAMINELDVQLKMYLRSTRDCENTIVKFRQKTSVLQSEIDDLKEERKKFLIAKKNSENIISKFRQETAELQDEINDLKEQIKKTEEDAQKSRVFKTEELEEFTDSIAVQKSISVMNFHKLIQNLF